MYPVSHYRRMTTRERGWGLGRDRTPPLLRPPSMQLQEGGGDGVRSADKRDAAETLVLVGTVADVRSTAVSSYEPAAAPPVIRSLPSDHCRNI